MTMQKVLILRIEKRQEWGSKRRIRNGKEKIVLCIWVEAKSYLPFSVEEYNYSTGDVERAFEYVEAIEVWVHVVKGQPLDRLSRVPKPGFLKYRYFRSKWIPKRNIRNVSQ